MFPGQSWLAPTPEAALRGLRKLIAQATADLAQNAEEIPQPLATRPYSGRFLVRVPPDRHRTLALLAAAAGISLNRLASAKLAG